MSEDVTNEMAEAPRLAEAGRESNFYSPLLEKTLSQEERERAALVLIEDMELERFPKLLRALERWGVDTALDASLLNPNRVLRIPYVGISKLSALIEAVKKAAFGEIKTPEEAPSEELASGPFFPFLGRELSPQERAVLDGLSIEAVIDDVRGRSAFKALRKKTVLAAARVPPEQFLSARNTGRKTLKKAIESIERAISELRDQQPALDLNPAGVTSFVDKYVLSCLSERERMVLMDRYGLWDGVEETLEDIGGKVGVTRERIRQIQVKVERKLRRMSLFRLRALRLIERFHEASHRALLEKFEGLASLQELEKAVFDLDEASPTIDVAYNFLKRIYYPDENLLAEELLPCGYEGVAASTEVKERFEQAVEAAELALVAKGRPRSPEELTPHVSERLGLAISPSFLRRCAEITDKIALDDAGRVGLRRWQHFNPRNIEQMARSALLELGQPSHHSHIVAKMNVLFPKRAPFLERSVYGRLIDHPEIFVSLGRGVHALTDWGIKRPPFIRDFLVEELRSSSSPLSADELVARGVSRYGYRESSLRMTLNFNKQVFKELPGGLYKLAS